jgi:pimeloyl-ACP methyl ester carboxylesterase
MSERLVLDRDGVRLACIDFGGAASPVVLLHGLAGHAGEWSNTASWLLQEHRVIAIDARGHGDSERSPDDVSRDAHVADAAFVIQELELGHVTLVGQSLGGQAAFLTAAAHPDLLHALVVVEATPESGTPAEGEEHVAAVGNSLAHWPTPFPSEADATEFWGGPSVKAEAWVSGLEERDGGLWPRFDVAVMTRTLREAVTHPYWQEWKRLRVPTLVVRGTDGPIPRDRYLEMVEQLPGCQLAEVVGGGHDLHLERPEAWRAALSDFLRRA